MEGGIVALLAIALFKVIALCVDLLQDKAAPPKKDATDEWSAVFTASREEAARLRQELKEAHEEVAYIRGMVALMLDSIQQCSLRCPECATIFNEALQARITEYEKRHGRRDGTRLQ